MKIIVAIFLVTLAAFTPLGAKPLTASSEGISIEIPDDWNQVATSRALLFAQDPTHKLNILLLPSRMGSDYALDAKSADALAQAMADSAKLAGSTLTIESVKPIILGGMETFEIQSKSFSPNSSTYYLLNYPIIANDKSCLLGLQSDDVQDLPRLRSIAATFHFLAPPKLPPAPPMSKRQMAYKLAAVLGVVLGLAFVAWILIIALRRFRSIRHQ